MESDEEDLIHSAMQHVAPYQQSPSPIPNDAIRSMLQNLVPNAQQSPLTLSRVTPMQHQDSNSANFSSALSENSNSVGGVMGDGSLVAVTMKLTPVQVGQLIEFCTRQRLPMPEISSLPNVGPPRIAPQSNSGHSFTVTSNDPETPPSERRSSGTQPVFFLPRNPQVVVGPRPSPMTVDTPNMIMGGYDGSPQPGDEGFLLPECFGEFTRISPHGHDAIRNPGKDVPLARMVLLKIPHSWGPPHMMAMLQKLDVKCYFARKHTKSGPRGEVSKGSGKVLIHELEEERLMAKSGMVWCVPEGFYIVRHHEAASQFLETNKHRWGKHLPYELLKVEREARELCERGRVAMTHMKNGSGAASPMGFTQHTPMSGTMLPTTPFRVSSAFLDEMTLSPSGNSNGNFQRPVRCGANGFMQSASSMSLTSNTSSFECLPHS